MHHSFPACLFFVAGAVCLVASGDLGVVDALAFLGCASCAGLSVNKPLFSVYGGIFLIITSLGMQVLLSHHCILCLKTDFLILGGILCLAIVDESRIKQILLGICAAIALVLVLESVMHTPLAQSEAGVAERYGFSRYLAVYDSSGAAVKVDTLEKPVLIYSQGCKYCLKALNQLARYDPGGDRWVPVEKKDGTGDQGATLRKCGYTGKFYTIDYPGPVPVYVFTEKDTGRTAARFEM